MDNQSMIKRWLRFGDRIPADRGGDSGEPTPRRLVQARRGIGYLCCLLIAEIPLVWFLGIRRGFFLWWEYLGFLVCVFSIVVARDWLIQIGANKTLVAVVAPGMIFGCFICLHHAVRLTRNAASPWASRDPS